MRGKGTPQLDLTRTPSLGEILISSGSFLHMLFLLLVLAVYAFQLLSFVLSIPRLLDMYAFYTHLLRVPDVSAFVPREIHRNLASAFT